MCFLTDRWGAAALVQSVDAAGSADDMDLLRSLNEIDATRLIGTVTTMICWRATQGIYRIDSTVYSELITTPFAGELPVDVLLRLPEWCVYVETPGLLVARTGGDEPYQLRGVYARLDFDDAHAWPHLMLLLDMPAAPRLESGALPLRGTLADSIAEGLDGATARRDVRSYIEPVINLLLYLCTINDYGGPARPANPEPVRTRRDGWRLFPPSHPRVWDVGVRMGAALRAAYHGAEIANGGAHAGPRPHIRRAHWHGYWSGPRSRDDGSQTPSSDRHFKLHWQPATPVNLGDIADLPATIRRA